MKEDKCLICNCIIHVQLLVCVYVWVCAFGSTCACTRVFFGCNCTVSACAFPGVCVYMFLNKGVCLFVWVRMCVAVGVCVCGHNSLVSALKRCQECCSCLLSTLRCSLTVQSSQVFVEGKCQSDGDSPILLGFILVWPWICMTKLLARNLNFGPKCWTWVHLINYHCPWCYQQKELSKKKIRMQSEKKYLYHTAKHVVSIIQKALKCLIWLRVWIKI